MPSAAADADLLERVRAEYREMPCLRLSKPQMQRLWQLDSHECDAVVDTLLASRVLRDAGMPVGTDRVALSLQALQIAAGGKQRAFFVFCQ